MQNARAFCVCNGTWITDEHVPTEWYHILGDARLPFFFGRKSNLKISAAVLRKCVAMPCTMHGMNVSVPRDPSHVYVHVSSALLLHPACLPLYILHVDRTRSNSCMGMAISMDGSNGREGHGVVNKDPHWRRLIPPLACASRGPIWAFASSNGPWQFQIGKEVGRMWHSAVDNSYGLVNLILSRPILKKKENIFACTTTDPLTHFGVCCSCHFTRLRFIIRAPGQQLPLLLACFLLSSATFHFTAALSLSSSSLITSTMREQSGGILIGSNYWPQWERERERDMQSGWHHASITTMLMQRRLPLQSNTVSLSSLLSSRPPVQ